MGKVNPTILKIVGLSRIYDFYNFIYPKNAFRITIVINPTAHAIVVITV